MATNPDRVVELITKLSVDEPLRQKIADSDESGRLQILSDLGYSDVSLADLINFKPAELNEVSDEELDAVAGGADTTTTTTVTTVTAAASSAVFT